jgi:hypothetical protein
MSLHTFPTTPPIRLSLTADFINWIQAETANASPAAAEEFCIQFIDRLIASKSLLVADMTPETVIRTVKIPFIQTERNEVIQLAQVIRAQYQEPRPNGAPVIDEDGESITPVDGPARLYLFLTETTDKEISMHDGSFLGVASVSVRETLYDQFADAAWDVLKANLVRPYIEGTEQ